MTILQAIILGIVQGLTEFLPVSSSGHLALFVHFFGFSQNNLSFEITLHVATLLAVLVFFRKDILRLKKSELIAIVVGTLPAVFVGLFLKDLVEELFVWPMLVSLALLVTGMINLFIDKNLDTKEGDKSSKQVTWRTGLLVGMLQAVAIIPGISRSGSTVAAGLYGKLDRQTAFRFSFMLAIPAILGATVLQLLHSQELDFTNISPLAYALGALSALIVGLISLYAFKYVMLKARFEYFAYYCFAVAFLSFIFQVI